MLSCFAADFQEVFYAYFINDDTSCFVKVARNKMEVLPPHEPLIEMQPRLKLCQLKTINGE